MAVPEGAVALATGTALALGAAGVVLGPLFRGVPDAPPAPTHAAPPEPGEEERSTAIDALREIEFDRATGKLSDADYSALKQTYTQQALAELRARDDAQAPAPSVTAAAVDDAAVEAVIARYRPQAAPGARRALLLRVRPLSRRPLHALRGGVRRGRPALLR
jgi:hypothetical protein